MLNALKKMFGFAPVEPVKVEAIPVPVVAAVTVPVVEATPAPVEPVASVVETAGTPVVAEVKKARRAPAAKKPRVSRKEV